VTEAGLFLDFKIIGPTVQLAGWHIVAVTCLAVCNALSQCRTTDFFSGDKSAELQKNQPIITWWWSCRIAKNWPSKIRACWSSAFYQSTKSPKKMSADFQCHTTNFSSADLWTTVYAL